jgi:hypothetical protein
VNSQAGVRPWLSVAREFFLSGTVRGTLSAPFAEAWQPGAAGAVISFAFCSQKGDRLRPSPFVILVAAGS